jgi:glutamate--cysteine ligase catalytic subunit
VLKLDHAKRRVRVCLRAEPLLHVLSHREDLFNKETASPQESSLQLKSSWKPEFCAFQIESSPGVPYLDNLASFNSVEHNMRQRRLEVHPLLEQDEILVATSAFPMLGTPDFTWPPTRPEPHSERCFTKSLFWPSNTVYLGHPRYSRIATNIRQRKGEKVAINVPIYRDSKTPDPFVEDFSGLGDDGTAAREAKPDHVYMDATAFGMGLCCLQVTFQAECLE